MTARAGAETSNPREDWVDELVDWAKGEYPDYCGGGGGCKALKAVAREMGVEAGRGWKDTVANLKRFGRESKLVELMADPDGEYTPPQLCGKKAFPKYCAAYGLDASMPRSEAMSAILRIQGERVRAAEEEANRVAAAAAAAPSDAEAAASRAGSGSTGAGMGAGRPR